MSQGRLHCVRPSDLLRSGKRASKLGHLPTASSLYRSPQSAILPSWSTASGAAATCRTVWVRYRADGTLLGTMPNGSRLLAFHPLGGVRRVRALNPKRPVATWERFQATRTAMQTLGGS